MEAILLTKTFSATPEQLFTAWMDAKEHKAMIGGGKNAKTRINPKVKGAFTIWDGYITGTTIELQPNEKIVQLWRTTDFPSDSPDSVLQLRFKAVANGTKLTITHKNIPDGQGEEYKKGWKVYYFEPMSKYFAAG